MISFFIRRPIATTLLALGFALAGVIALTLLPVSPLPNIDIPTISVSANMAGASPETMSTSVATPLERHLGAISDVTEMTSRSSVGSTQITLQFSISRDIDGAARDVQAAISAARADLPTALRSNPQYRKFNPANQPILVLALTSKTLTPGQIYDYSTNILQQRLSQIQGVGDASPSGASLPAVRVEVNPRAISRLGISLAGVSTALSTANAGANSPKGDIEQGTQRVQVYSNDNATQASEYENLIVAYRNGAAVRLKDIADVYDGQENIRNVGMANGKPAVLISITQQPGANVLQVVDRVKKILPELQKDLPNSIDPILIVQDPTVSIRNSVRDVEVTLVLSTILVVLVVFLFLRNWRATLVPAISVPLALVGTFSGMFLMGYSLDNFSLMALIISTGFVVDNTIVVLENVTRHLEEGRNRLDAALLGTGEVAFTVVAMSISLVAVFLPILLYPGIVGKIFHEFALTLTIAIFMSLIVSLSVTPMMCAYLTFSDHEEEGGFLRTLRRAFEACQDFYRRTLGWSLDNPKTVMAVLLITVVLNVFLFTIVNKGFFPETDEGRINGQIRGDQSISFQAMQVKFQKFVNIIRSDPAVQTVAGTASATNGNIFITLKPKSERGGISSADFIDRLRPKFDTIAGARAFLNSVSSVQVRAGGRQGNGNYQYTLQADSLSDLNTWLPKITEALQDVPEVEDINSDQQEGGLEIALKIDRLTASRLGITTSLIDATLGNAFSQKTVSTIYQDKNQYHVVMEVARAFWQSPETLHDIYVSPQGNISGTQATAGAAGAFTAAPATGGTASTGASTSSSDADAVRNQQQNAITSTGRAGGSTAAAISTKTETMVPLSDFVTIGTGTTPLSVNHQGPFVAATFSYGLPDGVSLSEATAAIQKTMNDLNVPISIHGDFAGTAQLANSSSSDMPLLLLAAVVTIYIVLGMLYESYVHPITILSTLPSAGVGAILAIMIFGLDLSLIADMGVLLLIGIVKKNAIIMIDFAIEAQRRDNLSARDAIFRASILRFRPIMMTTMGAILGALPLAIGVGEGYELRQPLGISIVGGLLLSQALTLYTTPVIYLYMDRWRIWCARTWQYWYDRLVGANRPLAPAE